MAASRPPCRWWEAPGGDGPELRSDCRMHGFGEGDAEVARAVWDGVTSSAGFCPFCGAELDFTTADEVAAEARAEEEHREEVRRMRL